MKKVMLLMVASLILASCSKEKKFDENLQNAYSQMVMTYASSSLICSYTSSAWRDAIYDHKTPSGKYCSDFNDALKEQFDAYRESGLLDTISVLKDHLQEATSLLNNPPSSRKDCYDEFVDIVADVSALARMAIDPTGSLSSFNSSVNTTTESISRKLDQFKIKYSAFLKKED